MADDLTAPLGRRVWTNVLRRRFSAVTVLLALTLALLVSVSLYVLLTDDPLGGEPVAVAAIIQGAGEERGAGDDISIRKSVDDSASNETLPPGHALPPADIVITEVDGSTHDTDAGLLGDEEGSLREGDADPDLVEPSRHGLLPVVAPDGRRPADVYAGASGNVDPATPRIALFVGAMGLSTTVTEDAIRRLPSAVTLAFAPYGREAERLVRRARRDGHEIMLQVPLEPYDYPDNDPGPHTLLTGLSEEQNRDRLHWVMSRFTGYVGVTNYMGGRFTASREMTLPFLGELRQRGLVYADDSTSPRSLAGEVAEEVGLPFVAADLIIDAEPTRAAIDAALAELEDIAHEHGRAIGVASGLPAGIEQIADWIPTLESKGITLVPLTALVSGGES